MPQTQRERLNEELAKIQAKTDAAMDEAEAESDSALENLAQSNNTVWILGAAFMAVAAITLLLIFG